MAKSSNVKHTKAAPKEEPKAAPKATPKPAETPAQQDAAVSAQVHENLQSRGASMSEVTQAQASAQGTPSADALAAAKGEIITNTPDGQKVVQPAVKDTETQPKKGQGSDSE